MAISKDTVAVLVDLIENKLAGIQIDDREDLREVLTLQNCLSELRGLMGVSAQEATAIPHRGRHRKLTALMDDMRVPTAMTESRQSA